MEQVYSVTQVNQYIKNMFVRDGALSRIYIKGEVSNCKYHSSNHIYFTLKDNLGQMACVMFAGQRKGLKFKLEEGQSVIVLGNISIYERDGKYQLYANEIVLDGQGILYEKYEQLKRDLEKEGLFDESHKKPIPAFPKRVGVITAKTGAVIQDIINIANRRNPYVQLFLYPAKVQGVGAGESVARGIRVLDAMNMDTIIVGRGGGSIEDLWAFNEEIVARAIFACNTPIISAVGHETDITIADFVADLRAPTPSAAAELAINDYMKFREDIRDYHSYMARTIMQKIAIYKANVREYQLKLDYSSPQYQIKQKRQLLIDLELRLNHQINQSLTKNKHLLQLYAAKLEGLSPLNKLKQGYALVSDDDHKPVQSISQITKDDKIRISLIDGNIDALVTEIKQRELL